MNKNVLLKVEECRMYRELYFNFPVVARPDFNYIQKESKMIEWVE